MRLDVPYGITRRIQGASVPDVRTRVATALSGEGFGVLTEIDVQRTLETKIGEHIEPYLILGACNPKLAHRAITADPAIGLLLPCNVVVAQDGPDVVVSAASPRSMFSIAVSTPALAAIAGEAEDRLRRAVAAV